MRTEGGRSMAKILVTGGAGYIGSCMSESLVRTGHDVVVLDNLSTGHREAVLSARLVIGDLADVDFLARFFAEERFDAAMHFAALIQVAESIHYPEKYYQGNVKNTLNLLAAMRKQNVHILIF